MRVRWTAMVASLGSAIALDGTAVFGAPTMSFVDVIRVPGGMRLDGDVTVSGAKNAALKLMAVALLAPGRSVVENVPRITDIRIMAEVVRRLGCEVTFTESAF